MHKTSLHFFTTKKSVVHLSPFTFIVTPHFCLKVFFILTSYTQNRYPPFSINNHLALIDLEDICTTPKLWALYHIPPVQSTLRLSCSFLSPLSSSHADYRDYSLLWKVNYTISYELCQKDSPLSSLSSASPKNLYKILDQNGTWYVVESCKHGGFKVSSNAGHVLSKCRTSLKSETMRELIGMVGFI